MDLQFDLDIGAERQRNDKNVPLVYVMTLDLSTGSATRRRLSPVTGDFPTVNNKYIGVCAIRLSGCCLRIDARVSVPPSPLTPPCPRLLETICWHTHDSFVVSMISWVIHAWVDCRLDSSQVHLKLGGVAIDSVSMGVDALTSKPSRQLLSSIPIIWAAESLAFSDWVLSA